MMNVEHPSMVNNTFNMIHSTKSQNVHSQMTSKPGYVSKLKEEISGYLKIRADGGEGYPTPGEDILGLKSQVRTLENRMEDIFSLHRDELDKKEAYIQELKYQVEQREGKHDREVKRYLVENTYREEIKNLGEGLLESQRVVSLLKEEVERLQADSERKGGVVDQFEYQNSELLNSKQALQSLIAKQNDELAANNNQQRRAVDRIEELQEEVDVRNEELAQLRRELEDKNVQTLKGVKQFQEMLTNKKKGEEEMRIKYYENEELRKEVKREAELRIEALGVQKNENLQKNKKIENLENEIKDLLKHNDRMEKVLEAEIDDGKTWESLFTLQREETRKVKIQYFQSKEQIQEVNNKLFEAQSEMDLYKIQVKNQENSILDIKSLFSSNEECNHKELKKMKTQLSSKDKEIHDLFTTVQELRSEIKNGAHIVEIDDLKNQILSKNTEFLDLNTKYGIAIKDKDTLGHKYKSLESDLIEIQSEYEKMLLEFQEGSITQKNLIFEQKSEIKFLKDKITSKNEAQSSLEEKIKTLKKDSLSKNIPQLSNETVEPYKKEIFQLRCSYEEMKKNVLDVKHENRRLKEEVSKESVNLSTCR